MSWFSKITGNSTPVVPPEINVPTNDQNTQNTPATTTTTKSVPSVGQWSNFDPTGLERAARAAKDLEKSKHSKDALDIARIQEVTKQNEYQSKIKEKDAYIKQLEIDKVRVEQEEKRRTMEAETKQYRQRADYQDKLSRQRHSDQLANQERMNEKNLAKQEESVKRQEALKKQTIDYKAQLKKENELAAIKAKVKAQAELKRETHDLELQNIKARLSEYRATTIETLKTGAEIIGSGFSTFLNNPYQCGTILGMSLGLKSIKAGVNITSSYIESHLGKPSLIRETSRFNRKEIFTNLKNKLLNAKIDETSVMRGIFLDRNIEEQLIRISLSTINTRKNNGFYRNLLFHGPPGTGKTLFAKSMAHTVGMDYAIMTGGDIAPLGKDAVTSLHNVFRWAVNSKKGLLLFVDEADAFLKKRDEQNISEDMRNALNAFLYQTGTSSKKFMLVLATNLPDQLDRAINDRIDELVEFTLPGENERKRLLRYYYSHNIKTETELDESEVEMIDKLSKLTDGLSGREISKLAISWQASAFASINATLTRKMVLDRAEEMVQQHNLKLKWNAQKSAFAAAIL